MVGNGMAGVRTLEELLKAGADLYDITVFGDEPHPNYNRIMLSPVLAGSRRWNRSCSTAATGTRDHNIALHTGKQVVKIDRKRRCVEAEDGTARRLRPPADGHRLEALHPARSRRRPGGRDRLPRHRRRRRDDRAPRRPYKHAVVIGGGLLGLEAANGLKLRGMDVTVVHIGDWLLERQLDEPAAPLLQQSLEAKGLNFLLKKQTAELVHGESGRVCAVKFKDGERFPPTWW